MNLIEKNIEGIVDAILSDYQGDRDIDKIDLFSHPDKAVITDMIQKLLRIVYPGFYRDKSYRFYNVKHNLSMLIEDVMYNLNRQVSLMLIAHGTDAAEAEEKAQQVCVEFFGYIPRVRALVQTDVQAAYDGDPAATSKDEVIFCYPGLFAITVYRLAHVLYDTLKGFGVVNKADVNVFLELTCFFYDPMNVGNLICGSSAFSKTSLNVRKFTVHILLKLVSFV